MIAFRARRATALIALSIAGACYDRPNSAQTADPQPAASGEVASADTGRGDSTATSRTPASDATGRSAPAPQPPLPASSGEVPRRARRDSVALASMTKPDSVLDRLWPVRMPRPISGAVLPARRIVAFYGNPLSKKMGVLGEYPKEQMLGMLDREAARWRKADPSQPVVPALHLIVTVAQAAPGKSGLYRMWMRDSLVNEVHSWAKARKALFFMDVQVGKSTVPAELPRLRPFLEQPDVHLGIDPEFAMASSGSVPGRKIGTLDAKDINWAVDFLDEIVRSKKLPPKILVVHRFTRGMVTNASKIRYTPNVQVVMHMDGWGPPWLKFDSYHDYVKAEPVQFTGFKLFFHNDTKKGDPLLTPAEVLRLNPRPLYIQYQ